MKKIKVALISNYLTIHQIEVCKSFLKRDDVDFRFISSFGPNSEKLSISNFENEDFVLKPYLNERTDAIDFINQCDSVIFGSGDLKLISEFKNKLFFYSEHFSKDCLFLLRIFHVHKIYKKFKDANLLCSSAYSKRDYKIARLFLNNYYAYGYFPPVDNCEYIDRHNDICNLLWVGRDLKWKRMNYAFLAAKFLSKKGIRFNLKIVSKKGETLEKLCNKYKKYKWFENITFFDHLEHKEVLRKMKSADIYLFTSNKKEGWGAVLNEAMSAGCCCIACKKAGSTNFLIQNKINGFAFKRKRQFLSYLYMASTNSSLSAEMGRKAKNKILKYWNSDYMVESFVKLVKDNKITISKEIVPLIKI